MKVYIAGKISELKFEDVFIKFNAKEFELKRAGHTVVNPLRLVSQSWSWEKCMKACIRELAQCDAICLLPDWTESKGARLEYHIAQELKLELIL